MRRIFFVSLAGAFGLVSFFIFSFPARGEEASIVITEIGAFEASTHEWVEVMNTSETPLDLTGWVFWESATNHGLSLVQGGGWILEPDEFAIIAQDATVFLADHPTISVKVFDSAWGSLNESGEEIGLKDASGIFHEQFIYISAPDFSLERVDETLTDYSSNNWKEHPSGSTPGIENYWATEYTEEESGETPSPTTTPSGEEEPAGEEVTSAEATIVINEFLANPLEGEEWIELFDKDSKPASADISGWYVEDGTGRIATLEGALEANGFLVVELSSSKLNNGGDILLLKNQNGDVQDSIAYGSWDDGNMDDNAPTPGQGQTLGRHPDGTDSDIDSHDFKKMTVPTPLAPNASPEEEVVEEGDDDDSSSPETLPLIEETYLPSTIVINELVSDPADERTEFVELYNTSLEIIPLDGWYLEDGSETKTRLTGAIGARSFFVIDSPKGSLNNSGDQIILFAPGDKEIDRVSYGRWDDGNISDNAPAAEDPQSLARRSDGTDLNNDIFDFVLTESVTKGEPNVITGAGKEDAIATESYASLIINEIFPNPEGSDNEKEFIELWNSGSSPIDLSGLKLSDSGTRKFTIPEGRVEAGGYIVFERTKTGIALNNSGSDEVQIFTKEGVLITKVGYSGSAEEEQSYARTIADDFVWTEAPTPGKENVIKETNTPPTIVLDAESHVLVNTPILFDASDTTDADKDTLAFSWSFGDGEEDEGDQVEHTFTEAGIYTVAVTVEDSRGAVSEKKISVTVETEFDRLQGARAGDTARSVRVNEILPNPAGSDTAEFIELFNAGEGAVDLSGFKLDDEEGGSRAYILPEGTWIEPKEYKVFGRQETGIALNNTSDEVRLLFPDGEIASGVAYDGPPEGGSYAFSSDDVWTWSEEPTPGKENVIAEIAEEELKKKGKTKKEKIVTETTLEKIREEDPGDMVRVTGTVAVLPGVFGTQYLYIVENGGVQVYFFHKEFPVLAVGDRVSVTGELSETKGETRLKMSDKKDMTVLSHGEEPEAAHVEIASVGEVHEGMLVEVEGEITEKKSSYLWVDDGSDEIKIYIKKGTGITSKSYALGDIIKVRGIVSQSQSLYQLLPRGIFDIQKIGIAEGAVRDMEDDTAVPSEKEVAEKYLTATAGGLTSLLIGLVAKARGAVVMSGIRRAGRVALLFTRRRG